jgi:hypothetical protein
VSLYRVPRVTDCRDRPWFENAWNTTREGLRQLIVAVLRDADKPPVIGDTYAGGACAAAPAGTSAASTIAGILSA